MISELKNIFASLYLEFPIDENTNIMTIGVDSISFLTMINEIENHFKIEVNSEDLFFENFDTISKIVTYIEKLQKTQEAV